MGTPRPTRSFCARFAGVEGIVSQFLDEGVDLAEIDFGPGSLFQLVQEPRAFRVAPPPQPGLARLNGSQLLFANLDVGGQRPGQVGQEVLDRRARFPVAHFSQQGNQGRDGLGIVGLGENQGRTQADRRRRIEKELPDGVSMRREVALGQEDDGRGPPQRVVVAEGVDHCWVHVPIFVVGDGAQ